MFRSRFLVHFNDLYARMIWGNKPEAEISKKLTSMDIITILINIWFSHLVWFEDGWQSVLYVQSVKCETTIPG